MLGKKLSPGIWGDRFNGLLPAWKAPVVQVVLYRTWKWTISFESTSEGGGRARARIQQLLQDHSFQDIHLFHLLGEPFPSYFHLVGSLLPSSPLGQELHWGSRSRPHTSWVESSFTRKLLFFWWFWMKESRRERKWIETSVTVSSSLSLRRRGTIREVRSKKKLQGRNTLCSAGGAFCQLDYLVIALQVLIDR